MKKIDKKIVAQKVIDSEAIVENEILTENIEREELLDGVTVKVKSQNLDHALYITVNFQTINGIVRPFEVFFNTKDISNFQWLLTITRMLSAIFRKGGEYSFIFEEMKEIHDPKGGYYARISKTEKPIFMTSLSSHIGYVLEKTIKEKINEFRPIET